MWSFGGLTAIHDFLPVVSGTSFVNVSAPQLYMSMQRPDGWHGGCPLVSEEGTT